MDDEAKKITNDLDDSGGLTNWGITKKAYEAFTKTAVSVDYFENLTLENKKWFYQEVFWKPLGCDKMEKIGVAVCIFDTAVLYGATTGALLAQKTADICGGALKIDGILGPQSVIIINAIGSDLFIDSFRANVLSRVDTVCLQNPKDEKYRNGWTNRANRLLTLKSLVPVVGQTT
jgi:lysozyme family protein